MTFIVISKDAVLSDNIAKMAYRLENKDKETVIIPYDKVHKIAKINNKTPLGYGERIQAICMSGVSNDFTKLKKVIEHGVSLRNMLAIQHTFGNIFNPDSCLIAICDNGITNWTFEENHVVDFKFRDQNENEELLFFGSGDAIVTGIYNHLIDNTDYKPTALDMMVMAQSMSGEFGTTFDWFCRKTETLKEDIELNEKTRLKIINKIKDKLDFPIFCKDKQLLANR